MYQEKHTGLFLPDGVKTGRALRREAAERALIEVLNSGYSHYGASRSNANVRYWNSYSASPKEDIEDNLDLLRQRSRDAYMGIPTATAMLKTLRTNVIAGGLMPSPQIDAGLLHLTSEQAETLQAQILREFSLWADSPVCDADRVDDFYGLQQLAYMGQLMNGDAFALLQSKPRVGSPYDLRIRLVEADRICSPNDQDRLTRSEIKGHVVESVVQGVETDAEGGVLAYWIAKRHPRAHTSFIEQDWIRVEVYGKNGRRNVLHVMQRERAGQRRGVPLLAPMLETLKQLERYADAETTAALLGAIFTVFIKKGSVSNDPALGSMSRGELLDRLAGGGGRGPNDLALGKGVILDLELGESIETVETKHPHADYDKFMMARVKELSASAEIPVEVLFKQFDRSNFSSSRGALNEFWRTCGMLRDWFAEDFCQPVYEAWFAEAVARGRIYAPGFFNDPAIQKAYTDCKWNGPARTALNPSQEVEAAIKRVEAGFSTAAEETAQLTGGNYDRNIRQRLIEAQRKREVDDIIRPLENGAGEKGEDTNAK